MWAAAPWGLVPWGSGVLAPAPAVAWPPSWCVVAGADLDESAAGGSDPLAGTPGVSHVRGEDQ